jgi:hypothetical protein
MGVGVDQARHQPAAIQDRLGVGDLVEAEPAINNKDVPLDPVGQDHPPHMQIHARILCGCQASAEANPVTHHPRQHIR